MVSLVSPSVASLAAVARHNAWIELVWGTSVRLAEHLGQPEVGHHLPGLGPLSGWGVCVGDGRNGSTGAIYTGFVPATDSVSVMLSATCSGVCLELGSVDLLFGLPSSCLERMAMLSLVPDGRVLQVFDRVGVLFETRSRRALERYMALAAHLVGRTSLMVREGDAGVGRRLCAITNAQSEISRYELRGYASGNMACENPWIQVADWE